MSLITDIIVSGLFNRLSDEEVAYRLKEFTQGDLPFLKIDGHKVGGTKSLVSELYVGSFNYMDYELFCKVINGFRDEPQDFETIQIFINSESEGWKIVTALELTENSFL